MTAVSVTTNAPVAIPRGIATVLFDLDGTLTDPKVGITASIRHAMAELGRPLAASADLDWCIGPPLIDSFARLLDGDRDLAARGVAAYRARYGVVGLYENEVYPGIPDLLDALVADGRRLVLATSKPRVFAERILEHFDLARRFAAIHGSELDGTRVHKTDLLPWILEREAIDPTTAVMVGDREHDALGARAAGLATIGVAWGYGRPDELVRAGAARIATDVAELADLLGVADRFAVK
ncbi:MAG: HAD hydrolase-like protein [Hyphomicrobiales bacterium]|nr:HAD hydrolase-like protein [Hyphomicrobiales bacterium]